MAIGVVSFPAELDTLSTLVEVRGNASTTIDAPGIDADDTTIPVPDTSSFPNTGVLASEGEQISYTGKTATSFTGCARGQFIMYGASSAAAHAAGTPIRLLVLGVSHIVHSQAIVEIETKIGTTPGAGDNAPDTDTFLVGTGAGESAWRVLASGDVSGALGFTPANKAGDTFTDGIAIDDGAGSPAATGAVRLRNTAMISGRNAVGNADVPIIGLDGSDRVSIRNGAALLTSGGQLTVASLVTTTSVAAGGVVSGSAGAFGTNPAAAGAVRVPNDTWIAARNAINNADVNIAKVNAAGAVLIGAGITVAAGGAVTLASDLAITEGGTGASDAADARTNLGLGTIATQAANNVAITGGSVTGITDLAVADGGTGASTAANARTNLGLGTMALQNATAVNIDGGTINGITDLAVADGGTGASTAANARTNLGLGTIATQNANNVAITGGAISGITDLAVADGGTGASTPEDARSNLGAAGITIQVSGTTFNTLSGSTNGGAAVCPAGYRVSGCGYFKDENANLVPYYVGPTSAAMSSCECNFRNGSGSTLAARCIAMCIQWE